MTPLYILIAFMAGLYIGYRIGSRKPDDSLIKAKSIPMCPECKISMIDFDQPTGNKVGRWFCGRCGENA